MNNNLEEFPLNYEEPMKNHYSKKYQQTQTVLITLYTSQSHCEILMSRTKNTGPHPTMLCSWTSIYHHAKILDDLKFESFAELNTGFFFHEQHTSFYLLYSGSWSYHGIRFTEDGKKLFKIMRLGTLGEVLEVYHPFSKAV